MSVWLLLNHLLTLDNLLAWSAQIAVLVAVAVIASMTLSHPRARLLFWQGVLAIALLLPAVEPWIQTKLDFGGAVSVAASSYAVAASDHSTAAFVWKREYLVWIAGAGALLRGLWICVGLLRLRRHRRDARMLTTPPVPFANPCVRWFVSPAISGPVTFGFLYPVILLPERIASLPEELREVIAHHELIHVRRRDWLFVLVEEIIRGLFWFHPAIWFVLSRIQLAREQTVDAEVVDLTRDRRRYLDALVAAAAQKLLPDLAPAPLFLKKRQLAVRVAAILKEGTLKEARMSKPRLIASFATVSSAALFAVRAAVWFFPLQAPAQTITQERAAIMADGVGVSVDPGGKLLHRTPVFYPAGVTTTGIVTLEASLNTKGEVNDAHVVSGPSEFRSTALASVLGWHYDASVGSKVQITIRFTEPPQQMTVAASSAPPASGYIKHINFRGLSPELTEKVLASLPVHVEDVFQADTMSRVRETLKEIDEHLIASVSFKSVNGGNEATLNIALTPAAVLRGVITGVTGGVTGGVPGGVTSGVPGGIVRPTPTDAAPLIRVGSDIEAMNLVKKVTPVYPPLAKQARIEGLVRFRAVIGKDGTVLNLELVSGHPLLVEPAQDAVKQWVYKPVLLNGEPIEVATTIDVNFTLSQ